MRPGYSNALDVGTDLDEETLRLIQQAEQIAEKSHDGHLSILRFTTCWKCVFGTFDADLYRHCLAYHVRPQPSLKEALKDLLNRASKGGGRLCLDDDD